MDILGSMDSFRELVSTPDWYDNGNNDTSNNDQNDDEDDEDDR
jgi:hypothetical protein